MNYKKLTSIKKICIIAGEVSGDQLGAGLIKALKKIAPQLQFVGIGGELMRQAGCDTWYDIADLSYFGIVDVVKNLPSILKTIKNTKQKIKEADCELFIGIDNPDFNLRIEHYCKNSLKIPTIHYVSPSVWAWRQGRVKTIRKAVSLMLCLLPFEEQFYQERGLPAVYVGHRLARELSPLLSTDKSFYQYWQDKLESKAKQLNYQFSNYPNFTNFRGIDFKKLSLSVPNNYWENLPSYQNSSKELAHSYPLFNKALELKGTTVACLPGSRSSEINQILPQFLQSLTILQEKIGNLRILIPVAKPKLYNLINEVVKQYPNLNIILVTKDAHKVLQSSAFALVASGTATLDTMLCHLPMVVGYKLSTVNYWLASKLIKTKYVALSNIILDFEKGQEMIQELLDPSLLARELLKIADPQTNLAHRLTYYQAHHYLDQDSDNLAALSIEQFLTKNSQS